MDPRDQNPYAPPQASSLETTRQDDSESMGLHREGRLLVATKKATFPDRCVKCNQPANGYRLKRNLYWHPPAYYLILIVCNVLIYALVALFVRKTATFRIGICRKHRMRRRYAILFGWFCVALSFVLVAGAVEWSNGWLAIASAICALFGIIYGVLASRMIAPKRINKKHAWILGAGPNFLSSIDP